MMKDVMILVGPSAGGKTTVAGVLSKLESKFSFVRSMTTRPERFPGDNEYFYVDEKTFSEAKQNGELLESMTYGEYSYGTPKSEIERIKNEGKYPLMILDLVGNQTLKNSPIKDRIFSVYLWASLDVIEERLYNREMQNSDTESALKSYEKRKERNVKDYISLPSYLDDFDAFVECTTPEDTAKEILAMFTTATPQSDKAKLFSVNFLAYHALNH